MMDAAEILTAIDQALKRCRQERERLATEENRWRRSRGYPQKAYE